MLKTIKKRIDFIEISKKGKRIFTKGFILQKYKRNLSSKENFDDVRVGYTITKKVGGAVIRNKIKKAGNAPVLPNSIEPNNAPGIAATMPEKIINEIPFPTPLEVICSPSHIKNIVPPTSVVTVVISKNIPGLITILLEVSRPFATPNPCIVDKIKVP